MAFLGGGEGARGESTEEAIAPAGDLAIAEFAERARDETEKGCGERPRLGQGAEAGENGVRADQHLFVRSADVAQDHDRVSAEAGGASPLEHAVLGEDFDCSGIAAGGKAEAVFCVMAQEPANGTVAKAAFAVVEDEQASIQLQQGRGG